MLDDVKRYFKTRGLVLQITFLKWRKTWPMILMTVLWGYDVIHNWHWYGLGFFLLTFLLGMELGIRSARKEREREEIRNDIINFLKNRSELEHIEIPIRRS